MCMQPLSKKANQECKHWIGQQGNKRQGRGNTQHDNKREPEKYDRICCIHYSTAQHHSDGV